MLNVPSRSNSLVGERKNWRGIGNEEEEKLKRKEETKTKTQEDV